MTTPLLRLQALMLGGMLAVAFAFDGANMRPPGRRPQLPDSLTDDIDPSLIYHCVKHDEVLTSLKPPFGVCPEDHLLLRLDDPDDVRLENL